MDKLNKNTIIIEKDKDYIVGTYHRLDVAVVSGKGSHLYDENGKGYIDFGSGIAVNTFGACDDEWQRAVTEQIKKIQHTSNYYYTEPSAVLAEMLCKKSGMDKVFFSNSGAEANECAIKAARKYGTDKDTEKNIIITMKNSFHGRTVTTLSATGQDVFHKSFTPFTEGFLYVEPENIEKLKDLAKNNKCCAVMLEVIQGEGGVNCISDEYLKALRSVCDEYDMLLIIDEVQTGNGRTGKYFAYMHSGIKPDIVTTAKGLAGGLPIGATLFSEKTSSILECGSHGSTFGGNPVSCAAAVSIVKRLDDAFLAEVCKKGEYIKSKLAGLKGVKGISGRGLMLGIETEKNVADILAGCLEKGLMVLTAKDKIRLLPPLNISYEDIDKGLEILKSEIQ